MRFACLPSVILKKTKYIFYIEQSTKMKQEDPNQLRMAMSNQLLGRNEDNLLQNQ